MQMKKLLFLFLLSPFVLIQTALAQSSANVNINNSFSSSSQSETNVKTDIKVETNGHVTTYSSDKPENIEVKSEDGKSEIKVDGRIVSDDSALSSTPSVSPTEKLGNETDNKNGGKNFFDVIEDFLNKVFSLLV